MHPTSFARRRLAAGVLALMGLAYGASLAQPPAPPVSADAADVRIDAKTGALIVPLGGVVKFTPQVANKLPIRDVTNRNEDILDARVDVRSPNTLVLVGKRVGATQLILTFGEKGEELRGVYDVVIQPDYDLLRSVIRRAVPTAQVEILPGAGSAVILTGYVARPDDADTVLKIASDATGGNLGNIINAIQVGGTQHVLIDVTVAQVDRTELRQRGFNFGISSANFGISSTIDALASPNVVQNLFPFRGGAYRLTPAVTPGPQANIQFGIVPANFIGALQALKNDSLAKILTEPKVVTQTGRPAFLRSGGQQATIGPAAGINGPGVVLQPFGTEVEVLPIVFGNGRIYLEVNPRITSVNFGLGISTGFGLTPGFTEQQTRASVMLESGQTFAIGGLIESQVQANVDKVPVLGEMPYVGTLFSTIRHQLRETELLVLVTPRLVEPLDCNQAPRRVPGQETRSPDDYELFLENLMEAPRGQRQVWTGKHYNAAYKCDPTYGKYPCIGPLCTGGVGAAGCAPAAGAVVVGPATGTLIAPVGATAPAVDPTAVTPADPPAAVPAP